MVTVPGVREVLDGAGLVLWGELCLAGLERHCDEINALNVFPIADADTGTNLLATMRAAVVAARITVDRSTSGDGTAERPDVGRDDRQDAPRGDRDTVDGRDAVSAGVIAGAMARAATAGARGNSGIILSQVLRGVADAAQAGPLTALSLREALRRAATLVREALSDPVEGTMLTVLDAAAHRAADCPESELAEVARAAADGAVKALGDTPSQLGVLRAAGVVDAGARGLLVLLDALVAVITGQTPAREEYRAAGASRTGRTEGESAYGDVSVRRDEDSVSEIAGHTSASFSAACDHGRAPADPVVLAREADAPRMPQYEVMYLLSETDTARAGDLRDRLARLGDSVVVVGDGAGVWSAHVHCADAGAAVEAGLAAGTLSEIRIEGLTVRVQSASGGADRGILVVAAGEGAVRLFEDAGATVLDGSAFDVTAETLLAAIRRMPNREVLVLPNGALGAHELVAVGVAARGGIGANASRDVLMLPSGSMVQGLAALAVHDGGRIAVDDAFAMSESAAGMRWGALRVARERALTIVGTCARGDGLGLVGNDVVVIDPDPRAAARILLDRMLGLGGELVTLLLGADAPDGIGPELTAHITAEFPGVEVVVYGGGQPVDLVQIGVE
ncbi:DAK2 domain-containing protein [Nocardia alni]|uniref:DAK2 domain-containing protein n=1 Tax=Nocardia alni TaxID=2815723 RepID=UPI001C22DC39|nr:DAK2 domain-containing protein [Nocardia alni]